MYPYMNIPFWATLALYQDMQETWWWFTLDPKLYHKLFCIHLKNGIKRLYASSTWTRRLFSFADIGTLMNMYHLYFNSIWQTIFSKVIYNSALTATFYQYCEYTGNWFQNLAVASAMLYQLSYSTLYVTVFLLAFGFKINIKHFATHFTSCKMILKLTWSFSIRVCSNLWRYRINFGFTLTYTPEGLQTSRP